MKKMTVTTLIMTVGVWAGVPVTVQAACNAGIIANAPDSRYTDNGDGTVTDMATGLMWKQCSEGLSTTSSACDTGTLAYYTWQDSLKRAADLNSGGGFAGYTDWRLPNRKELTSLVERQCWSPSINANIFPATGLTAYWSSSPYTSNASEAWTVIFSDGIGIVQPKSLFYYVRLVRGGQ